MNFQLLIGMLKNSQDDSMFSKIVGYDHIKRLFRMALESDSTTHILLTGPPASAKTMFLTSLLRSLKNAYFIDGGNSTKAGVIDYLFENRPSCLLIDEADKLALKHQTFLLNLMETGIVTETKCGKTRETKMNISVFATSNDTKNLSSALLSRFFVVELEPYSDEQFYQITTHLMHHQRKITRTVADAVWNTSRNLRDCVRIGALARTEEDVKFLLEKFISPEQRSGIEGN